MGITTRKILIVGTIAVGTLFGGATGGNAWVTGNDTGGIIPWPDVSQEWRPVAYARAIAEGHCARYGKIARITSVHPRYGDYIGFACFFDRRMVW